jgi:hypothetical protein
MTGKDDEITRQAKRNLRAGVPDIVDMYEAMEIAEGDKERQYLLAVAAKMQQLTEEGWQAEPMPELSEPARLETGDLRFLAKSDAMRERAEAALASHAVEDWIFFNGEEDEKVTGRVTSVEPVHALAYFTVRPEEDEA